MFRVAHDPVPPGHINLEKHDLIDFSGCFYFMFGKARIYRVFFLFNLNKY